MAQHDYVLANNTGALFRTDVNNALAAIVSNNSGNTEPATKFAGMHWLDTSVAPNGLMKVRNQGNTAWVEAATVNGTLPIAQGGTGQDTLMEAIDAWHVQGASITAATTTDLSVATGDYLHITGNTQINGLTSQNQGDEREVIFDGSPLLQHNATSFILLHGRNMQMSPGDRAKFRSEGSGNWRMTSYNPARSASWETIQYWTPVSGTPSVIDLSITLPWTRFRLSWEGLHSATSNTSMFLRVKVSGSAVTTSAYQWNQLYRGNASPGGVGGALGFGQADAGSGASILGGTVLCPMGTLTTIGNGASLGCYGFIEISGALNSALVTTANGMDTSIGDSSTSFISVVGGYYGSNTNIDGLRIACVSGSFQNTGQYRLDGMR